MNKKVTATGKNTVIFKPGAGKRFLMADGEYTDIVAGKADTDSEYVISDGIIEPGSHIPDHYHKWEDQTFHLVAGSVLAKIGNQTFELQAGDSIQCPRGVTHFMKNTGNQTARLISYIFPGDWAEDFMAETSRQTESGRFNLDLIEEMFGVVYVNPPSETA